MRIQHNIPAMNSYRNYANNVSKVSKNLEKLSTGYKINRAGDDAAGLAISEKMRIQITGLEKAQANAKSGINLVQTAEGALTEVHDMLNRMFDLAEQSANGTYDNTTDRNQLQKEVTQLKTEIDRIADSSNFNGIKLLDGSLEEGGTTGIELGGNCKSSTVAGSVRTTDIGAAAGGQAWAVGDKAKINLQSTDGATYTIELEVTDTAIVDRRSGASYSLETSGTVTEDDVTNALIGAIRDATGNAFEFDGSQIKSIATGSGAAAINGMAGEKISAANEATELNFALDADSITNSIEASAVVGISNVTAVTKDTSTNDMKSAIFTINDQKFLLVENEAELTAVKKKIGDDVTLVWGGTVDAAAGQICKATGLIQAATGNGDLNFLAGSGKGLTLQIGDTSETFNKLTVSIKDVHCASLGISGVNIGNQNGAASAMDIIKQAVNTVSDIRGGLGATQNRLDHTINNLSVMQENIQDSESTIRDVDVAKEMMGYTKNNILVQSAQAMLAQANQLPQGVLQLLG